MYGLGNRLSKQYFFPRLLFRRNSWLGLKEVGFRRNSIGMFLNTSQTQVWGERRIYFTMSLYFFPFWFTRVSLAIELQVFSWVTLRQIYNAAVNDKVSHLLANHSEIIVSIEKSQKASDLKRFCQNINFAPRRFSFTYYTLNPSGK